MNETYGLDDLLNTLVQLEEAGNRIYTQLAASATEARNRELFERLAAQELLHRTTYIAMRDERDFEVTPDAEYLDYIGVLIQSTFHLVSKPVDRTDALATGIQLEKDTLLFLNEVYNLIGATYGSRIKIIMNEERKHLKLLLGLRL